MAGETVVTEMQERTKIILSVKGLRVDLDGRSVLSGLSFDLHAGEMLAIIGPNGSGKTVLLRTLLHLLPYQGKIGWMEDARIGYVPQRVAADRQLPLFASDLLNAKAHFLKLSRADVERVSSLTNLTPELLNDQIDRGGGGHFENALRRRPKFYPAVLLDRHTRTYGKHFLQSLNKELFKSRDGLGVFDDIRNYVNQGQAGGELLRQRNGAIHGVHTVDREVGCKQNISGLALGRDLPALWSHGQNWPCASLRISSATAPISSFCNPRRPCVPRAITSILCLSAASLSVSQISPCSSKTSCGTPLKEDQAALACALGKL